MRRRSPITPASTIPLLVLLTGVAVASIGCGGAAAPEAPTEGGWQVERSTDGPVTTVRNITGSKWGAAAQLELQLEIGVEEGEEAYMLAQPVAYAVTDDEIFVLDYGLMSVRVYGADGTHHRDFGRAGQGPGEFEQPIAFGLLRDDRIVVASFGAGGIKLSVFDLEGQFLDDWSIGMTFGSGSLMPSGGGLLVVGDRVFLPVRSMPTSPTASLWYAEIGIQEVGPEGFVGEPWMAPPLENEPPLVKRTFAGRTSESPAPFAASRPIATLGGNGEHVWGHPDAYRFHIERPDGTEIVVEREVAALAVDPDEARYQREGMLARLRQRTPDADISGDFASVRAFYHALTVDDSGRIWVSRTVKSERIDECTPANDLPSTDVPVPCWNPVVAHDAFNLDGEYLGSLEGTVRFGFGGAAIRRNTLVTGHQDEAGTAKVRIYRIIEPGQEGQD